MNIMEEVLWDRNFGK